MAIIKRARNIEKIAYNNYVIMSKELNKIAETITIESAKESMTISGATTVNIKANSN
ncbi:MAG: hypothetical protein JKY08_10355 [Flavobacteriaceae bacterium]|nr:hypothetical protein [Flavobacteriaceae bacterium]